MKRDEASLLELVEHYKRYYASGTSHTARAKRLDLDRFIQFLTAYRGLSKPEKLTVRDWDHSAIQRFIDDSLRKAEAPASVTRRLATLKHMGKTLSERVPDLPNAAREVRGPKLRVLKPHAITDDEAAAVKEKAHQRTEERPSFNRYRNEIIFDFILDTGLRADEVRLLKLSHLSPNLDWIKNVKTKAKQYRNVYISSPMRKKLKEYLAKREEILKKFYEKLTRSQSEALPLFISTYDAVPGKPDSFLMGAKSLWRAINELSVDTQLHPHLLRHSYAIDLLDHTNDIRLVAQALGHSDVRVTMRYTERTDDEVAKAVEGARRRKAG